MKITILTLFPKVLEEYLQTSIIKIALAKELVNINVVNIRDYSLMKNKAVDDYGCGGGPGMIMSIQPVVDALKVNQTKDSLIINLSPAGNKFNHQAAIRLSKEKEIVLICGHYEGIDERVEAYIDTSYSIGDYVLTGGELPALVLIDALTRLIPGVINNESLTHESFSGTLLDYPVYTKPLIYDNLKVPDVLLSGNHQLIKQYRQQQQIIRTKKYRQDLYQKYLEEERKQNENQ